MDGTCARCLLVNSPGNHLITDPRTIRSPAAKMAMIDIAEDIRQFDFKLEFVEIKREG